MVRLVEVIYMPIDFNKLADAVAEKVRKRIEAMTDEEREEWIKKQKEKSKIESPSSSDQSEE